jgi:hypothetical protein
MPLFTDNIDQARRAYNAVESRAQSAEQRAMLLEAIVAALRAQAPDTTDIALLRQRILDLEAENVQLRKQLEDLARVKADMSLQQFVESIGLAAAVGEASMPDRAIVAIAMTVQAYVSPSDSDVGIRFQQPELGALAVGLSSTSLEVAKIPPQAGVAAPRNLYAVMQEKQHVYSDPFWTRFEQAAQIVAEIAKVFANTGGWNASYLIQAAANIAAIEQDLVSAIAAAVPSETAAEYRAAVDALSALTSALSAKASPVAGDLFALSAALDTTTSAARKLPS